MCRTGWLAAALVASGVGAGCDARNLETMPDAGGPPFDAGPLTTEYRWGDVSIHVAPTGATTGSMTLWISDPGNPAALLSTLMFPPATMDVPANGAQVRSRHGCSGDPTLAAVEILSCADEAFNGTTTPGCMYVSVDYTLRLKGNFIHPNGARCDIQSGSAEITLPPLSPSGRLEAAKGTFVFPCRGSDGTDLELEGMFLLPQFTRILAC